MFCSSGVWWRYAGESLLSTSPQDRSEHRRHAGDRRAHGRLGRLLEWGVWEVRSRSCCYSMCGIIIECIQYKFQIFILHSVNRFRTHRCTGQVLSLLVKIHRFESNCCVCACACVCVAESDSASPRGATAETAKRTAERSSSTPLSKSLSLLHWCVACWSWCTFSTTSSVSGIYNTACDQSSYHQSFDVYVLSRPNSLRHYCHILPGIGLGAVQLFWCGVGKTRLRNNQVCIILFNNAHVYLPSNVVITYE